MKKLLLLLLFPFLTQAQIKIRGKITDTKGEALAFANVSLLDTYDGATSAEDGTFSFETTEKGSFKLQASIIGYHTLVKAIELGASDIAVDFALKETINQLNAVVVSAGVFEASDSKRMVMLKPLDIVTTAGGNADITSVMQLLPGSSRVGEQEGLFVRGGSAQETKTVIDGMIVQNPFFSSTPDVPQRGRFEPFMFKGTAFSTGGYSAQYGQALSSVLLLSTQDQLGTNTSTTASLNLAGAGVSHTHKGWITGSVYYTNIAPLLALVKNRFDFETVPQGIGTSLTINKNLQRNSTFKLYGTWSDNTSAMNLPSYDPQEGTYRFANRNKNLFTNASYKYVFKDETWVMNSGLSYSNNRDNLDIRDYNADRTDERTQARVVFTKLFGDSNANSFNFGGESHYISVGNRYNEYNFGFNDSYSALFAETEMYFTPKLAVRPGLRYEYTSVLGESNLAPRLSLAYKAGQFSQFSFAGGRFYQNPEKEYLYTNRNLTFEQADHLILNYQVIKNKRTFRTEAFYKKYDRLVKEETGSFDPDPYRFPTGKTSNTGNGYARGFDVFFRDEKAIKNGDLWITYSFLDTRRDFKNYPKQLMPSFAARHNMSLVTKKFFTEIGTNVGVTYSFASGRPVYAPADDFSTREMTKPYQTVSIMASKIKQTRNSFLVFYFLVDNLLGRDNIFGYRYSPDGSERYAVKSPMKTSVFFGMSWTFGKLNGRSKEADLNF
ncbi:TonB-dependent receptor [Leadbetterella sp. DM7]|uniref:TonB-dependent receptor n=1 Tax=Leadbetterella sp. DM7 TaxID=3235085 RepID=UPI00349EF8D4